MKKFNVSLAVVAALSLFNSANAQSLEEALKAGKFSGEFTATYEKRSMDKEVSAYYSDTAYSVGSFAIGYQSGVWNNLSLTTKFRAYKTLFENDDNFSTGKGTGDASERFWQTGDNKDVDFESLFITYANDNVNVKMGRQPLNTKWLNKTHDAINANFKFGATNVEAIWTRNMGRVTSRDYRPLSASDGVFLNKGDHNAGVYKLGLTHDLGDIDLMAFYLTAPDDKDLYGGQIAYANDTFGASAQHTIYKPDDSAAKDGSHTELKAFYKVAGYTTTLGHLITSDTFSHFGMGTTNAMEEGDKMYSPDAKTTYLKVNKKFGDLSATLISGQIKYGTTTKYKRNETTLWLGYPIAKNLKANLGYTMANEDKDDATRTDLNQLNLTIAYSF